MNLLPEVGIDFAFAWRFKVRGAAVLVVAAADGVKFQPIAATSLSRN